VPQVILCSDAARTAETAKRILPELEPTPDLQLLGKIYHASPDTLLDLLHKQTAQTVAIIGHNPGIGMMANGLVLTAPVHHRFSDYPTCAVTVIDFAKKSWADVAPRTGTCIAFTVPRDLIGTDPQEID
jgi:phosphohistidine phosphatase